jgi:regulator of sirC expression with transglutaminase-like and TPR domain
VRATDHFADLVARPDDEIPLDEAALMIAYHARPGLDVGEQLARLDDLAGSCKPPDLDGMLDHLFVDLGFRGNTEHYRDPDNSYLDQVLRRRLGIPISLSLLTMEVGRRLGVGLDGVGMPGHFLLRSREDPALFLDPFNRRRLDAAGCRIIFESLGGTGWDDGYLAPVGARSILNRMLLNLQGLFLPADLRSAAWVLELRLTIPGLVIPDRLGLARALGSLGHFSAAAGELDRVAEGLPDDDAARLRAEAKGLRARAN